MDLLHKRYANPFPYVDNLIEFDMFSEFIEELVTTTQKEEDEAKLWEFFLHKVHDKSFTDWKNELGSSDEGELMKQSEIEATIKKSQNILNGFSPEDR